MTLLTRNVQFIWSEATHEFFTALKMGNGAASFTRCVNPYLLTIVAKSTSQNAIGAIMRQGERKTKIPAAVTSRTLREAQHYHLAQEREQLGAFSALRR